VLDDRLIEAGIEVLLDDRDDRPGVKFADMDLLGIPHRLVISDRGIASGMVEYKRRSTEKTDNLAIEGLSQNLLERVMCHT